MGPQKNYAPFYAGSGNIDSSKVGSSWGPPFLEISTGWKDSASRFSNPSASHAPPLAGASGSGACNRYNYHSSG